MSRAAKAVSAVLAVVLVAGVAVFLLWQSASVERRARAAAERVASGLAAARIDNADYHATVGVDPAAQYTALVKGMDGLKPAVTVAGVELRGKEAAEALLRYEWTVMPGKPPWAYDVTVPLSLVGADFKASWSPTVVEPSLQDGERLWSSRLPAARGEILGQADDRLAWNQPAVRVGIDKTLVDAGPAIAAARQLAAVVGIDPATYADRVSRSGPKAFVEAAVLRVNDPAQGAQVAKTEDIVGVRLVRVVRPLALGPRFARPLLGVVGEATAEAIAASGGTLKAGDLAGLSGLQARRDEKLRGAPGFAVRAVVRDDPSSGRDLHVIERVDGADVKTSVDVALQLIAEDLLQPVVPPSAVVAIRPSDGQVLVAASGPGGKGYSTATLGQYAPGSTFKTVSALGLLRAGATPAEAVSCPPSVLVEGMRFDNYAGYPAAALGRVPLASAFAHSCNTAFVNARSRVSQADLRAAADTLGLNVKPQLVLPGYLGDVPASAPAVEHAAAMIGQGKVLASPLGMATVAASIAKGAVVRPRLLVDEEPQAVATPDQPLSPGEQAALRTLMAGVVEKGGATFLRGTPGGPMLAKTGTASYGPSPPRFHAWMIAIQGDLAVAVFVEDGRSGAQTAGPLLKAFLTRAASAR